MVGDLTEISVGFQRNKNETRQLPRIDVGKIFFWGGVGVGFAMFGQFGNRFAEVWVGETAQLVCELNVNFKRVPLDLLLSDASSSRDSWSGSGKNDPFNDTGN